MIIIQDTIPSSLKGLDTRCNKMASKSKKHVPEYVVSNGNATIWKSATVILAVLFVVSIFTGGFSNWGNGTGATGGVIDSGDNDKDTDDDKDKDSVLVIEEYSEFACPFCGRFATETHDRILEEYAGQVEIEFKHFIVHPQSAQKPAEGYECAADQGKAAEYYKAVFENQQDITVDGIKRRAEEIGLDMDKFTACLESGEKAQIVADETAQGRTLGVGGTPTFFIGGEKVVGALPFDRFKEVIDRKLAEGTGDEGATDSEEMDADTEDTEPELPDTSDDPEIEFIVINDKTCTVCDTSQIISVTETQLFPTVKLQELDYSDEEAKKYVEDLEINALPAFIFGKEIEEAANFDNVINSLIKSGDYYLINPAASSVLKFLEMPDVEGGHVKGAEDGSIVIVEYSSFTCGFCNAARETVAKILDNYDDVSFYYKHFDRGGPDSVAAQATECAGDQDKFWEMHDKIFDDGASGDMSKYAEELGLDVDIFDECMDSEKYAAKVQADTEEGIAYGIQGTPGFIVGGILVRGAQPYENFAAVLDGLAQE